MNRRRLILIAGPAGAGKTTLAQRIQDSGVFAWPCLLSADWFYRRGLDNYELRTSVDETSFLGAIASLTAGEEVLINYRDHSQSGTARLRWLDVLMIEGLYVLTDPDLVAKADLRIYLTTSLYLAGARRALRDVLIYQDSPERALTRVEHQVAPALSELIEPQVGLADIRYSGDSDWAQLFERLLALRNDI